MSRCIPLSRSVELSLAIAFVSAIGAAAVCGAEPQQFLFGTATKVVEISEPGIGDGSPNLTQDELEVFFKRGDELYRARRATKQEAFGTPEMIEELSIGNGGVGFPSISPDGLTLYFSRTAKLNAEQDWGEIWVASRPSRDAPFDPPVSLSEAWGVTSETYIASDVSADDLSLYVTRWNGGLATLQVASRSAIDQPWNPPQPIPELVGFQGRSGISADGLSLFYETSLPASRETPEFFGNIVVSRRESVNDPWSEPVNLGDAINWGGYNTEPFLTHDGSSLYFWRGQFLPDKSDVDLDSIDIYQSPVLPFTAVPLAGQGGTYQQKFDTLGTASDAAGQLFPDGWTFTANDLIFNNSTTRKFPAPLRDYAGAFNSGASGQADRALTTNVTELEAGQLQFRGHVEDAPAKALRLTVDVEAWQVRRSLVNEPGEAAFDVILEADLGKGFEKVADLGLATTGHKLEVPKNGGSGLNGNDPANRGSFDTGPLDVSIPEGATLRFRFVPTGESLGWTFGLDNLSLRLAEPGDANIDGKVDLADFGVLKAHFGTKGNFTAGDFSGNGDVDLADFGILKASFGKSGSAAVPEPTAFLLATLGAVLLLATKLRRR